MTTENTTIVVVKVDARYARPSVAGPAIGLTPKAIERKIAKGQWVVGREFRRAPDGLIYVDMRGFEKWVEAAPG